MNTFFLFSFLESMGDRPGFLGVPNEVKRDPDPLTPGALGPNLVISPSNPPIHVKNERVNGFNESENSENWNNSGHDQICCLIDNGRRCTRPAGNASYNKRIQKTVAQKKLNLRMDNSVS